MRVKIIKGEHKTEGHIQNMVCDLELLKGSPFRHSPERGTFVLVTNENLAKGRATRVNIASKSDIILNYQEDAPVTIAPAPVDKSETYEDIKARIADRFITLKHLTRSICDGAVRGMIVSGPPGMGKTHEVTEVFRQKTIEEEGVPEFEDTMDKDASRIGSRFSVIAGKSTAPALYELLYNHRNEGQVLTIDDCDAIFADEDALNLLKAALDTSEHRVISWRVSSSSSSSLPNSFEFKGAIIFLTNLNFYAMIEKDTRMSKHLDALDDRCLVLDLDMYGTVERLARIEMVVETGFLTKKGLDFDDQIIVFEYFKDNADKFRSVTMRRILQLADLYIAGGDWKRMAEITLFKKNKR